MSPEDQAHAPLLAAHAASPGSIFPDGGADELTGAKSGADLLVQAKLARFADEGRTALALTNAGRYWALNGGYMANARPPPLRKGEGEIGSASIALRS